MRENPDGFPSSAGRFATGLLPFRYTGRIVLKPSTNGVWEPVKTSRGRDKPGRQGDVGMGEPRASSLLPIHGEVAFSSPFMGRWPEGPEGLGPEGSGGC